MSERSQRARAGNIAKRIRETGLIALIDSTRAKKVGRTYVNVYADKKTHIGYVTIFDDDRPNEITGSVVIAEFVNGIYKGE